MILYLIADAVLSGLAERCRRIETRWAWPRHADPVQANRSLFMTWEMVWSDNVKAAAPSNPVSPADFEAFKAAPPLTCSPCSERLR
ncbi:hypothetical protein BH18ACI5_BH18ACI5_20690 [soil metagenome]